MKNNYCLCALLWLCVITAACTREPSADAAVSPAAPAAVAAAPSSTSASAQLPLPATPPRMPGIVGWWDRPEALTGLGLTEADVAGIAPQLRNIELSYQLAQTQLREARKQQLQMLQDPSISSERIRQFHASELQRLSAAMLEHNLAARLLVREQLSEAQLATIEQHSPGFFRIRWFRDARIPVHQGRVSEAPT